MITVLITGCSRRAAGIIEALRDNFNDEKIRVVGVDSNSTNLNCNGADVSYAVPKINDCEYIPALRNICKKENVDVIFPYITSELNLVASRRQELEDTSAHVSIDRPEIIEKLNDKMKLYGEFWKLMPWQVLVKTPKDLIAALDDFNYDCKPICCKLKDGRGGQGFAVVDDLQAVNLSIINSPCYDRYISKQTLMNYVEKNYVEIILSQYVDGLDFSVYVLADHGSIKYMCGVAGHYVSYGSIILGEIQDNDKAFAIADEVVKETGFDGVACFDFKIDREGKPYLLECNPRLGASTPFVAKAGLNLPYLRCLQLLGREYEGFDFSIRKGLKMSKYYTAEYFD